jgi:hypothetical protein
MDNNLNPLQEYLHMRAVKTKKVIRKKIAVKPAPKTKVGIAWYSQEQWQLLLDVSADRYELEPTYAEWKKDAELALQQLLQGGLEVVKVYVKIEELLAWCQSQNITINGQTRSQYAAYKLKQIDKKKLPT